MRRLVYGGENSRDIQRIVEACRVRGYTITPIDAERAWQSYSASLTVGWMMLPHEDGYIVSLISDYCIEVDE